LYFSGYVKNIFFTILNRTLKKKTIILEFTLYFSDCVKNIFLTTWNIYNPKEKNNNFSVVQNKSSTKINMEIYTKLGDNDEIFIFLKK
jgi:hypothetical protein